MAVGEEVALGVVHVLGHVDGGYCGCADEGEFGDFKGAVDSVVSNGMVVVFVCHSIF